MSQRSTESAPRSAHIQHALAPGSLLNGRYRVVRVLGTGAFGRVYLAVDVEEPGHPSLAIKELLAREFTTSEDQQDAILWFKREVSILLTLDHPGVPAIHGYWTASRTTGPLYLAMDYVPGKTLADLQVLAGGLIPWPQVVAWGIDLCNVVAYLHSRVPPFIFRDLKPSNVLIDARTGRPVLIDFGLARQLVASNGTAIGTWGYVPFEQVLGKAEPRSDLYALAAVLHELLTNRHPTAEYRQSLRGGLDVEGALRGLFPPVDAMVSGVPAELSRILLRGTAFAPEDRYPDATAMRDALLALQPSADATGTPARSGLLDSGFLARALRSTPSDPVAAPDAVSSRLSLLLKPQPPLVLAPPSQPVAGHDEAPPASEHSAPALAASLAGLADAERVPSADLESERTTKAATEAADAPAASGGAMPMPSSSLRSARSLTESDPPPPSDAPVRSPVSEEHPATPAHSPPHLDLHPPLAPRTPEQAPAQSPAEPMEVSPPRQESASSRKGRWRFRGALSLSARAQVHTTLVVSADGAGDFTSIGAALSRAAPGSRIEVLPGLYREGLVLDRPVELCGAGPVEEIIIESATGACVLMHAAAAEIRGISLRCTAGLGTDRYYAVNIPSGDLVLEDCRIISNSLAGVAVHGQHAQPTIRRCTIRNTGERGVVVYNHAAGVFEGCDIAGQTVGVRVSGHAAPTLRQCRIHGGRLGGVTFVEHGAGVLEGCDISDNGHHGVSIRLASNPVIRGCRITRNGWNAVSVADNCGALVEGCDLRHNGRTSWEIRDSARPRVTRRDNRDLA